ncbi:MAG: NADH:flavin oxidoreductase/NADH oxidase family protein [Sandaracinaceae bacterium]|nr:NADH:flavin oxidoreductase/NADH oxidase family protein [Sandaracinaceae bacterium]
MTQLSDPLTLVRGGVLPNRLAKSAMSERVATRDGRVTEELVRLYERWASGGTGLLITGNVMVDATAIGEEGNVIVEDDRDLPGLRAWARAAKSGGAQVWMQINHPGRQSPRTLSPRPVAPSAVGLKGAGPAFAKPRALEPSEIEAVVQRFATTARIAERAGFDGVQIHGAHGYLVSQFLSPKTNLRDDAWGGDPVRRRRFLLEIIRAIRAAVGPRFAIGLKLNSADFQKGGFDEAESMELLSILDGEGLDVIEVSGGTYESAAMFEETVPQHESSRRREAFFLDYVEKARARVPNTPLMLTGGFRTRVGMQEALRGAVDVVGLARPLAAEPDLSRRLLSGEAEAAYPVRIATGIKSLDALLQGAWYQLQLDRMGRGLAPDPKLGRLRALIGYFRPRRGRAYEAPPERAARPSPPEAARAPGR